ncbi:MAG: FAD-dependent oxidoreductase [Actinobacteria bacterium]|nr:FAD-dependent oxidoreductase [Actinomycetota bacterium]
MHVRRRGKRIVLAGGGHAHLYSLARTGELIRRGFDVTLVDRSPYLYYSGMATGVISGAYAPVEHRIHIRRLVEAGGGRFVEGQIAEIRTEDREFVLEDGQTVPYDVASVCLGSEVAWSGLVENGAGALRVKPVVNTLEIRRRLLALGKERLPRILVVGGGAAGCEVAANTLALLGQLGIEGELTIAQGGESLLPDAPGRAQREILGFLRERGAKVLTSTLLTRIGDGVAWTSDGHKIPCDLPVLAVGVSPPDIFRDSRLPTDDSGALQLDRHLRSIGDERLFGGGDCVSFRGKSLPRLGVFAVRQGPVIFHNLRASLTGSPLHEYKPQKRYLYVLNLGDGTGLAVYGRFSWRGRLSWWLKHRIDERFVSEHSR